VRRGGCQAPGTAPRPASNQLIQPPAPSTIILSWLRSARTQLSARIAKECVVLVVAIRALIGNGKACSAWRPVDTRM
jgi:hypothetical protein